MKNCTITDIPRKATNKLGSRGNLNSHKVQQNATDTGRERGSAQATNTNYNTHKTEQTHKYKHKHTSHITTQTQQTHCTMPKQLAAKASIVLKNIRDSVSPEQRKRKAYQKLRLDFYNGELLKKQRGGQGVTEGYQSPPESQWSIDSYAEDQHLNDIERLMAMPQQCFL